MKTDARMLTLCALFAALTAASAFLKIPVGPVPVTLQSLVTAMAGVLLGPGWGALSQLVYVALGLLGLPIFAAGGGPGYLLQPSFGFLLGLIPAAWVAGRLSRGETALGTGLACLAGTGALYLLGAPYMYLILRAYLGQEIAPAAVLWSGMLVFLPGDLAKTAALAALCPALRRRLAPLLPA